MNRFGSFFKPPVSSMAIVLAAFVAGCGGDGGDGGGTSAGSSAAPGSGGAVCTGASCVSLGTAGAAGTPRALSVAGGYAILAKTGVSTVPNSVVTGNVGLSPAARVGLTGWSLITGFTDTSFTSAQVVAPGQLFAADNVGQTTSVDLTTAVGSMETAYTAAAAKPAGSCPGAGIFGVAVPPLAPGVYTCAVDVTIPTNFTLNGNATDVWVFQITGKLTQSSATQVILAGGALPKNVFWQVSGTVEIGTTALMQGVILAQTNIAMRTGSTINGRLLAQTAVTLDQTTVTVPQ